MIQSRLDFSILHLPGHVPKTKKEEEGPSGAMTVKHALLQEVHLYSYICLVLYESLTDTGFQDVMSHQAIQHHIPLDNSFHVLLP